MLSSSVAPVPSKVTMTNSPPGCPELKLVTSKTWPSTTTRQSYCFAAWLKDPRAREWSWARERPRAWARARASDWLKARERLTKLTRGISEGHAPTQTQHRMHPPACASRSSK